jgi:hypothetical protein
MSRFVDSANLRERAKNLLKGTRLFEHLFAYRCRRTTYSWCGEDVVIRSFYDRLSRECNITVTNGCIVDVGAFRPIALSNTYYFHKHGWH